MYLYGTNREILDTTNKIVLNVHQSSLERSFGFVCIDCGRYPGTKEEINVRKLNTRASLPGLTFSELCEWIDSKGLERYGCGWGDSYGLYILTTAHLAELLELNELGIKNWERALKIKKEKEMDREDSHPSSNLCPRCWTYCYGDCEASES